jgi:hypothetical protein
LCATFGQRRCPIYTYNPRPLTGRICAIGHLYQGRFCCNLPSPSCMSVLCSTPPSALLFNRQHDDFPPLFSGFLSLYLRSKRVVTASRLYVPSPYCRAQSAEEALVGRNTPPPQQYRLPPHAPRPHVVQAQDRKGVPAGFWAVAHKKGAASPCNPKLRSVDYVFRRFDQVGLTGPPSQRS